MGWANCGTDSRDRRIGYAVAATCDHPGCKKKIDRGLGYACGDMHGEHDEFCEGYFCGDHLTHRYCPSDGRGHQLCLKCAACLDDVKQEEFQDAVLSFLKGEWYNKPAIDEARVAAAVGASAQCIFGKRAHDCALPQKSVFSPFAGKYGSMLELCAPCQDGVKIAEAYVEATTPPPPEWEHKQRFYDLMLRWGEIDLLPVDDRFMTTSEIAETRRQQDSIAAIRAMVRDEPENVTAEN